MGISGEYLSVGRWYQCLHEDLRGLGKKGVKRHGGTVGYRWERAERGSWLKGNGAG